MSEFADDAALLRASDLFDPAWYLREYPDVGMVGIDPVEHYLRFGARMGRRPSLGFHGQRYLETYKDVAESGMNPLIHYLLEGAREGREPFAAASPAAVAPAAGTAAKPSTVVALKVQRRRNLAEPVLTDLNGQRVRLWPAPSFGPTDYQIEPTVSGPCVVLPYGDDVPAAAAPAPSIGVHLHLYYADLLDEFTYFLGQIPQPFSLYVSVVDAALAPNVERHFRECLPRAQVTVRCFENRGRDLAAFVAGFAAELKSHEWICHIHSKRSPHNSVKADWRRQLLVNLMGSPATVAGVFRLLRENPHLGLVFPEYHHSLERQISWGTNFDACRSLASRLRLEINEDRLTLFPAGSMFWARGAALAKLFDAGLRYEDFPDERAQVDGTIAHAIERLLGEVVVQSGYDLLQAKSAKQHNLIFYHTPRWPYRPRPAKSLPPASATGQRRKVVVYTAIAGAYDQPIAPEVVDPGIDYVLFSDAPLPQCGPWQIRPMDYWSPEPVRMARYVKMHPHRYFPDHDVAIWVDANVVLRGDLQKYLRLLDDAGDEDPLLGVPHPLRDCAYAEAEVVVRLARDTEERMRRQMEAYRADAYPARNGLIETNFLVTNLKSGASRKVMADWWAQLERFSHRDQLSLNYVLWKNRVTWRPLMPDRLSVRDHLDFAYLAHGANSGRAVPKGELTDPFAALAPAPAPAVDIGVDIVVCVHDALDDVRMCLEALRQAMRSQDRLVVVDDASASETANHLAEYVAANPRTRLLRHAGTARGYCASANAGMAETSARYVLLLNSDAVLTRAALEKMLAVAVTARAGIVGPMSNAASAQSIPEIGATGEQTAINALPEGVSVEQMDALCAQWSYPGLFPSVPLVHGFCQLIDRDVLERVGRFDEAAFPKGYGEENDLCMRAADAGFDLKIATNAFVYHRKSASYRDSAVRAELMRNGAAALKRKHSAERVARAIATMDGHPLLVRMRKAALAICSRAGQERA